MELPVNVFNPDYINTEDAISEVAAMINNSGANRNQRRRLERALRKTENIVTHVQDRLDQSAFKEYEKVAEKDMVHFFAILGIVFVDDYKWLEDDNHNQIESLFRRMSNKINYFANQGMTTDDIVKLLEEKTGIVLVPEK